MELNDAVRRVLGHWPLIIAFVVAAMAATALLTSHTSTYSATARLALDAADPQSRAEASGIADTARAIATSPAQVEGAMKDARIAGRDPMDIARNGVDVESLGASSVLRLSVSDPDARIVAPMANALAKRVIRERLEVTRGEVDQVASSLDRRISAINRKIVQSDNVAAGRPSPELARRRDLLVQGRSALEAQRVSLLANGVQLRNPSIISAATPPTRADKSHLLPDLLLAAFLGLVLGTAVASLIEVFRPTLAGGNAIADALDVPLLGTLRMTPDGNWAHADIGSLGMYLRLAAKAAALRNVRLVSASPGVDLAPLAQRLDSVSADTDPKGNDSSVKPAATPVAVGAAETAPRSAAAQPAAPATGHDAASAFGIRPFSVHGAVSNGVATGLVLISPDRLKRSDLTAFNHLLRLTPARLLGVATYETPRKARRLDPRGYASTRATDA